MQRVESPELPRWQRQWNDLIAGTLTRQADPSGLKESLFGSWRERAHQELHRLRSFLHTFLFHAFFFFLAYILAPFESSKVDKRKKKYSTVG